MLDATVAYAGARHQFGRPIGSFQAVKHAVRRRARRAPVGRELLVDAVAQSPRASPTPAVAVAMAKSYAGGRRGGDVGKAMQLHGGIGYTWENGIHVLKRAALNRSLFGSPSAHRARLAQRYSSIRPVSALP